MADNEVTNLQTKDPFADADEVGGGRVEDDTDRKVIKKKKSKDIHIRVQQRNGRKSITTVQGLSSKYDFKKLVGEFKKRWGCNGSVISEDEQGNAIETVIQLQGDQRDNLKTFLLTEKITKPEYIHIHGF